MSIFRGAFTALITPMKADGSVDFEGFRKNVKHQLQQGIDGLVPLGTTAETPTLDEKPGSEEDQIIQIVFEEVRAFEKETGKKIPVILGAGSNNTKDAVAYVERAKAAGADIAEDEEFTKRLDKEQLDFDVLISTPQYMPKLGKYARLLGPKGLMPNPKAGTVTTDIEKAVKEAKAGKIEYRVDKQAIVHVGLGKVSFGADKIAENVNAFIESLKSQKPASIKGQYVKSVFISTTMGPSIQVENLYN